jgi:hypothetical protein
MIRELFRLKLKIALARGARACSFAGLERRLDFLHEQPVCVTLRCRSLYMGLDRAAQLKN